MRRGIPTDKNRQPVKGVFIFQKPEGAESLGRSLMKTLDCTILSVHGNRMMVSTSRGNLQSIKKRWMSHEVNDDPVGRDLQSNVSQILIGGNV